ncbi:MAG: 2-amino-4-hydroxy-6-hydroxymethyldihydropteridine diphosphokinase, partial [Thermoanaerobaculia bacterium]
MAEPAPATVFVALGSNIEPHANIGRALERLAGELDVEAVSGLWESAPHGAPGTPRFLNAAVRISSRLGPASLRRLLRRIEADLGRRRAADRNAPRTIDLDIALYGDL